MDFKKQISELKIVTVTKPRVYLKWINTEKGRDKYDCYERVEDVYVRYVNTHNPSILVIQGDKFFNDLEEMYHSALANEH
jgi:hypothetical protein